MSHTIPGNRKIHKRVTPLALYESNYRRMIKLFPELTDANQQGNYGGTLLSPNDPSIQLKIIEQHRYTSIVKLVKQIADFSGLKNTSGLKNNRLETDSINQSSLKQGNLTHSSLKHSSVIKAQMILRVCFDAKLVEVISFQGSQPLKMYQSYPNKEMILPDEKKQLNYHLKHILEMSLNCMPEDQGLHLLLLKP